MQICSGGGGRSPYCSHMDPSLPTSPKAFALPWNASASKTPLSFTHVGSLQDCVSEWLIRFFSHSLLSLCWSNSFMVYLPVCFHGFNLEPILHESSWASSWLCREDVLFISPLPNHTQFLTKSWYLHFNTCPISWFRNFIFSTDILNANAIVNSPTWFRFTVRPLPSSTGARIHASWRAMTRLRSLNDTFGMANSREQTAFSASFSSAITASADW